MSYPPVVPRRVAVAVFAYSLALVLYELLLTRLFAVVLFASFAHLALALALLGTGVGAIAQHLRPSLVPAERIERRLGWIGVGLGLSVLLAVLAVLHFPVLRPVEGPLESFQETSFRKAELLDQRWFAALLPVLALPFTFAGLAFAGVFQRLRAFIGPLYGADLVGGALGALLFLPALTLLAGPDVAFAVLALTGVGVLACARGEGSRALTATALVLTLGGAGLAAVGATGTEVLRIQRTVGFSEDRVRAAEWTPLVRLALYENPDAWLVLLDNTSASEIPRTEDDVRRLSRQANRGLAYRLVDPPGKVAILAASAGPEVATARAAGFDDIEAIDLESAIFRLVAAQFPEDPANPYADGVVRGVHLDGRAAIQGSPGGYALIQMVHANLWSAAGMLANTWSPALLETREAFGTYLDKLGPDGVLSFGRGAQTESLARAASAALAARGVEKPWQALAWVKGGSQVALVRPRPWTSGERERLDAALLGYSRAELAWPLDAERAPRAWARLVATPAMTDDRPYVDTWSDVERTVEKARGQVEGSEDEPVAALYLSVFVQLAFVAVAGLLFLALPWALRGRGEVRGVPRAGWLLAYVACLGYGYLAVETVLVHALVLFVGHPTYAITVVVLAMLLGSGAGSVWLAGGPDPEGEAARVATARRLLGVLAGVCALGLVVGLAAPPLLTAVGQSWPVGARAASTFVVLFPLGLVMGAPFPLALRAIHPAAAPVIPWAWAINGWMSVVASLLTVVVARLGGYSYAFGLALAAYVVALALAWGLPRVGRPG